MTFGWHFYFLGKIVLFQTGHLFPELAGNVFLALALILPERTAGPWAGTWKRLRPALALPLAAVLLWREALLPPFREVFRFLFASQITPSADYLLSFLSGAVNLSVVAGLGLLLAVCRAAQAKSVRLTPVVLLGLAMTPVLKPSTLRGDRHLSLVENFYSEERGRKVPFPASMAGDFDVVLLHVCSFSWDDLHLAGLSDHPFLKTRFDLLFTRFNSATSYSNPAALRLLRAPCGQVPHSLLFNAASDSCYLFEQFRKLGYQTWAAASHDGRYDDMAKILTIHGKAPPPMAVEDLPPAKYNFDETPIYSDLAVLKRWWSLRQASGAKRAAVYFNTISLHQGSHRAGQKRPNSEEKARYYAENARALFDDFEKFFSLLESSGRRVAVVLVGEHGAALSGTKIQAPDLRAIPMPRITMVPAAVKFIGPGKPSSPGRAQVMDRPAGYLALASALADFIAAPPFGRPGGVPPAKPLPETSFLSEAENAQVLQSGDKFLYKGGPRGWMELPPDSQGWLP